MNDDIACVCGRLRRASRALTRAYDEALEPVGMTVTQFSILRTLKRMGEPTLAQLAEATAHEKSGLWRGVQPLIKAGWVAARTEGRAQHLKLTADGEARLTEALPRWTVAQTRVGGALGDRSAQLVTLLKEVEALV
jgi:DNA-binding MarR family transcriptional regulator